MVFLGCWVPLPASFQQQWPSTAPTNQGNLISAIPNTVLDDTYVSFFHTFESIVKSNCNQPVCLLGIADYIDNFLQGPNPTQPYKLLRAYCN